MKRYLIVGNGVAGATAAETIRKLDESGSVTMVTDEDLPFYYRIRLNDFLAGDIGEEQLLAKKVQWYADQRIDLRLKTRITEVDPEKKLALTGTGRHIPYDRLLLATGSHSFVPPIQGADKKGVFTLRDVRDARTIRGAADEVDGAVLIGGGLLGLEAGNALRKLGKKVMVVEFFPRLLPRQLDVEGAHRLQTIMEGMGFSFRLGATTRQITGADRAAGVMLEGGEHLPAGMVLISAGVRPNLELAASMGLRTDKGIVVDNRLETSRAGVFAAGDAAEHNSVLYGIWPAAMEQGKIAGANMAGGNLTYPGTTFAATLKVAGIDLASAGEIDVDNRYEARVFSTETVYKKIVLADDRIIGCIMLGDIKDFRRITRYMQEKTPVSDIGEDIVP